MSSAVFADNSARIKELSDEGNKIVEKLTQANKAIEQMSIRLAQIQGALDELSRQDAPKVEANKKDGKAVRKEKS